MKEFAKTFTTCLCLGKEGENMKLNYITIMVRSMEKSLKFYQGLVGLETVKHMTLERGEIVFLANGKEETKLELIEFKDREKVETKGMVMSYQAKESLEKLREKAIMLGGVPSDIVKQGPKPRYFTVKDPDGIVVEFTESNTPQ